jgi:hypothetical protein
MFGAGYWMWSSSTSAAFSNPALSGSSDPTGDISSSSFVEPSNSHQSHHLPQQPAHPLVLDGTIDKFAAIVVGGGSGGCVQAYFLAKWMGEHGIPGRVLLLDRGAPYSPTHGSSPLFCIENVS